MCEVDETSDGAATPKFGGNDRASSVFTDKATIVNSLRVKLKSKTPDLLRQNYRLPPLKPLMH
jgi:hypothetical protein